MQHQRVVQLRLHVQTVHWTPIPPILGHHQPAIAYHVLSLTRLALGLTQMVMQANGCSRSVAWQRVELDGMEARPNVPAIHALQEDTFKHLQAAYHVPLVRRRR